jgi:type I restriction-modification system DNA methylase subunit
VKLAAEREIFHLDESSADLHVVCSNPISAQKYFSVVDRFELEANEYNLNSSRYVDTFEYDVKVGLEAGKVALRIAEERRASVVRTLWAKIDPLRSENAL